VYVNQMNFNVKLSTEVGDQAGGPAKKTGGQGPPSHPLRIATVTENDAIRSRKNN